MIKLFDKGAYVFGGNQVVAEENIATEYKKYMEHSKLQRKGVKWVDYPNIW